MLRQIAARTVVVAPAVLVPLLATIEGVGDIAARVPGRATDFDAEVEIMELGHVFRITPDMVSRPAGYLRPSPGDLGVSCATTVGITWRSGDWDPRRSVPFDLIADLIRRHPTFNWLAFQRGAAAAEWDTRLGMLSPGETLIEEAGAVRALDLLITIDSMPAHLGGAVGTPTWTLLHADADWRWMRRRADTPWYPSMRLFRQPRPGDWETVLNAVDAALVSRAPRTRLAACHVAATTVAVSLSEGIR
jgi:hypothetical protein